ncbi:hypothetical protein ACFPPA_18095 [Rhodanobacter ginsengisoli]|uniref:Uncharacterized protein n=1 Tax=Rhodanobacter ginsengisoli TaxID=418646 RepID=A0ABW0QSB6_9GAMM
MNEMSAALIAVSSNKAMTENQIFAELRIALVPTDANKLPIVAN